MWKGLYLWLCVVGVTVSTKVPFNFEISVHVSDIVKSLLRVGERASVVVLDCFAGGLDSHNITTTSPLYFALLNANPELTAVYAGFEDGTFVWHGFLNSTQQSVFSRRLPGPNQTRDYFEVNSIGVPTTPLYSREFDPRLRPWYNATKVASLTSQHHRFWGSPYMFSGGRPGVTFSVAVYNRQGQFDGVVAIDFALEELSEFLALQYHDTPRSVYLIDRAGGLLLASPHIANSLIFANESGDALLESAVSQLAPKGFPETLVIVGETYIQCGPLYDNSTDLNWIILVTMPANPAKDYVGWKDSEAKPILVITIISLVVSISAICLTFRYRSTLMMKLSQLGFLSMFLIGCLLLDLSILTGLGTNTLTECRLRVWAPNFMFVFTFTPILAKTWHLSRILERRAARCKKHAFWALVVAILVTEFTILGVATTKGAMDPVSVTYLGPEGAYETHVVCGKDGPRSTFSWVNLIFNCLLVLGGSVLAFRSRNFHESLTESSALAINVYSILVFGLIYLVVSVSVDLDVGSYLLLEAIALGWGTTTSIFFLLGPRLYKLWKLGDTKAVAWLTRQQPQYSHTVPDNFEPDEQITTGGIPDHLIDTNFIAGESLASQSPFQRGLEPPKMKLERAPTFRRAISPDYDQDVPPSLPVTSAVEPTFQRGSFTDDGQQQSFCRDEPDVL